MKLLKGRPLPAVLGSMDAAIKWLLRDDFTDTRAPGAVNGTPSTPGPGSRITTDGGLSIGSGVASFPASSTGLSYENLTKVAGRVLLAKMTCGLNNDLRWVGVHTVGIRYNISNRNITYQSTAYGAEFVLDTEATGLCLILRTGDGCYVLAKNNGLWRLLWIDSIAQSGTSVYPKVGSWWNSNAIFSLDTIRIPDVVWLPIPLAYDRFVRANGALGSTEIVGPDNQSVYSRTWHGATWSINSNAAVNNPSVGSEILSDPGLEGTYTNGLCNLFNGQTEGSPLLTEENTHIHGGSKSQKMVTTSPTDAIVIDLRNQLVNGKWYRFSIWQENGSGGIAGYMYGSDLYSNNLHSIGSGVWTFTTGEFLCLNTANAIYKIAGQVGKTLYVDDFSLKELITAEMFSSLQLSSPDVIASVDIILEDLTYPRQHPIGLVISLDSRENPANYLVAYLYINPTYTNYQIKLYKVVAGVWTSLISSSFTYINGGTLRVIKNGVSVSVYYNNVQVGATQTLSSPTDNAIINGTLYGLFSSHNGNKLYNFSIFPRGNAGEYAELDKFMQE